MIILGIDVSKDKLDCYLSQALEAKAKRSMLFQVPNNDEGFAKIASRLNKHNFEFKQITAVLEPTSTYHVELIYWLYEHKVSVCLANPKDTHHYAKSLGRDSKTDRLDSFALAQFGLTRKLRFWNPPSKNIRKLNTLMRQRRCIIQDKQREENRLESLAGEEMRYAGKYLKKTIAMFKKQEAMIDAEIAALIKKDSQLNEVNKRLQTIPGVANVVAPILIILFSNRDFQNGRQAAAFTGTVPREYQSGSSIKGAARMSKRGPGNIRAALHMAAMAILTTRYDSPLKTFYERLIRSGKSKACALGALMHKLVVVAFAMWRDKTDYCIEAL